MRLHGLVFACFGLTLAGVSVEAQTVVWTAGADLAANETAGNTGNPNALVPEWSYGSRATAASSALTLFSAADHVSTPFQGFSNVAFVGVNVSNSAVVVTNFGFGDNAPVAPLEMDVHPSANNDFAVVRWTAPSAGDYLVTAYWRDIDPHGGNGATGDVVLNGTLLSSFLWANGGNATLSTPLQLTLLAGDKLDFVTGAAGDFSFDSTAFNAVIVAVPEPSTVALLLTGLGAIAVLGARRRAA